MPGAAFGQDGYQDVVLRYTGQAPRCFSVWQDSSCQESCFVSAGPAFRKLPFAELLFAYARTEQLSALLGKASPASIRTIKRQLAETGLRYGALNSETMLAVNGENGVSTGASGHSLLRHLSRARRICGPVLHLWRGQRAALPHPGSAQPSAFCLYGCSPLLHTGGRFHHRPGRHPAGGMCRADRIRPAGPLTMRGRHPRSGPGL